MGQGSYRKPADRQKKSLFDEDYSKSIKDLFSDEEVDFSWRPFETETLTIVDRTDCHTPRGSEESTCGCGGNTPCESSCGDGCKCKSTQVIPQEPVKKVAPDFYKKMKKESTERLNQKLNSDKYSVAEKKIISLIIGLRNSK